MALLLRCGYRCPSSGDPHGRRSSTNALLFRAADRLPCQIPFEKGRVETFFRKNVEFHLKCTKTLRVSTANLVTCSQDNHTVMMLIKEHFLHHKKSSILEALFVVNTSMLIFPFRALAETCESNNSIFSMNMPLLFAIALIGAAVGGVLARQRKAELARLNDQLRQINAALRRQAKIESYAPQLSYAPVNRVAEAEVIVDPMKEKLIANLREGKKYLRTQDPEKAFDEFKIAFDLAERLGDHIEEKKAARGLGASLQRQGKYKDAVRYHSKVLEIAKRSGEDSGCTEAYGAIADCYTEIGDLERAGKFYDKYIARLESD